MNVGLSKVREPKVEDGGCKCRVVQSEPKVGWVG
jgi:hypothetical protein